MKKKLLYVEAGEWHFDLFSSIFTLLEPHYEMDLFLNKTLDNKLPTHRKWNRVFLFPMKSAWERFLALSSYLWSVWSKKYDVVFFNTAHGGMIRWMVLLSPRGVTLAGIHHNAQKLVDSSSQKVISWKLKRYVVLGDFIVESLRGKLDPSLKLLAVYPIFFDGLQNLGALSELPLAQEFSQKTLKIAIPGVVEKSRRDYFGLVAALANQPPRTSVQFLILGNSLKGDGPALKKYVQERKMEKYFRFWDGFVENSVMNQELLNCDLVMPLIMPGDEYFEMYFQTKISGSYSLAYGYQKPLLMHQVFQKHQSLEPFSIFFGSNLSEVFDHRDELRLKIQQKIKLIQQAPQFQLEKQRDQLNLFLQ